MFEKYEWIFTQIILHTVIDGKSTDESHILLKQSLHEKDNLKWIQKFERNQADALNIAFSESESEWIGWLNSDEYYSEGTLDIILGLIKKQKIYVVIIVDVIFCDAEKNFIRVESIHRYNRIVLESYGAYISTCSFFVRREFLNSLGPNYLDPKLRISLDWDFFLRLFSKSPKVCVLKKNLGVFRVHSDAITQNIDTLMKESKFKYIVEKNNIRKNYFLGVVIHRILKLINGGYFREIFRYIKVGKPSI